MARFALIFLYLGLIYLGGILHILNDIKTKSEWITASLMTGFTSAILTLSGLVLMCTFLFFTSLHAYIKPQVLLHAPFQRKLDSVFIIIQTYIVLTTFNVLLKNKIETFYEYRGFRR